MGAAEEGTCGGNRRAGRRQNKKGGQNAKGLDLDRSSVQIGAGNRFLGMRVG